MPNYSFPVMNDKIRSKTRTLGNLFKQHVSRNGTCNKTRHLLIELKAELLETASAYDKCYIEKHKRNPETPKYVLAVKAIEQLETAANTKLIRRTLHRCG